MAGNPDNLLSPGNFVEPEPTNPEYARILGSQVATRAAANLLWRGAKGVAGGLWDMAQVPGRILDRSIDPYDPAQLNIPQYAANLAMMGLGAGSIVGAPYTSAGMFAGRGARTSRIYPETDTGLGYAGTRTLAEAEELEQAGGSMAHPDNIFAKTGWFRGPDNQWRFNISDEGAKLKTENMKDISGYRSSNQPVYALPDAPSKLGDVLEHKELFDAYPWMKNMNVERLPQEKIDKGSAGGFDVANNRLLIAPDTEEQTMRTILHETQHAIQGFEGFARGGGLDEFLPHDFYDLRAHNDSQIARYNDMLKSYNVEPSLLEDHFGLGRYSQPQDYSLVLNLLPPQLPKVYESALKTRNALDAQFNSAIDNYAYLAGEVEARTTERQYLERDWSRTPQQTGTLAAGTGSEAVSIPYPAFADQTVRFHPYPPGGSPTWPP